MLQTAHAVNESEATMSRRLVFRLSLVLISALPVLLMRSGTVTAQSSQVAASEAIVKTITAEDCSEAPLESTIPASAIGEPVSGVTLSAPRWVAATGNVAAYCSNDGAMAPMDKSSYGRPINFRVVLPAAWTGRRTAPVSCRRI